jgi:hypothetical protein
MTDEVIASARDQLKSYEADLTKQAEQIAHRRENPS